MALLFMDSFDHYASADISSAAKYPQTTNLPGSPASIGSYGRRSSNGVRMTNSNMNLQVALPSAPTTVIYGFAARMTNLNSTVLAQVGEAGFGHVGIRVNSDGSVSVLRFSASSMPCTIGTVLGSTAAGLITINTYIYYELKVFINATTGTVELHLFGNSSPVLNLTSQNTKAGGTGVCSIFCVFGSNGTVDTDDVYVCDTTGSAPLNNFLGDVRVDARTVTGNGTQTQWTPLSGANYTNVNDATPNGDTSYNSAASTGLTDTYLVQAAPVPGTAPLAVQMCADLKKSDAGICTVAPVVRSSGTNYVGAGYNAQTAYNYLVQSYSTNPATGAAWTEAGFNASEFGIQRTA